jgi:hypothetical protein
MVSWRKDGVPIMTNGVRNSSTDLIEEAKKERRRLVDQIEQSQRTIERSREIIARIDEVLAAGQKN